MVEKVISDEELQIILDNLQSEVNKLYEKFGASDEVIELQAAINGLRHRFDIVDESEKVYEDFVQ